MTERLGARWPDAAVAVVVLVAGGLEVLLATSYDVLGAGLFVVGLTALAAGLARPLPSVSLGAVWVLALAHLLTGGPVLFVELAAVAWVAFGIGRWAGRATVVLAGVSIPLVLACALAVLVLGRWSDYTFYPADLLREGVFARRGLFGALVLSLSALGLPFLAGLAARSRAEAEASRRSQVAAEADTARAQREAAQAQEIARLRDDQARLARDVHDVVGHSLAVILAQAQSAQYLPDDPAHLKTTLATIADSARSSLRDVRQVLSATQAPPRSSSTDDLVAGVRATGRQVVLEEVGTARPLPPELAVVAHRVLQEMLTNAVKHGLADAPVLVERHWPGGGHERDLRIEVSNGVAREEAPADPGPVSDETQPLVRVGSPGAPGLGSGPAPGSQPGGPGQGVEGMRRRLEAVGGRIDVRRRRGEAGDTFTATAWVPVSGG